MHVRGCRDGPRHERTCFHHPSYHSADRSTAFDSRAFGFFAGATPLCNLSGLLGWPHPGGGLAGYLGGGDKARAESNAHALRLGLVLNVVVFLAGLTVLVLGMKYRSGPLIALSPIGPFIAAGNLRYLLRGPQSRMHWWYEHLSSMFATGIAGYTAFLVFGGARLLPSISRSQLYTIFWVLPALIGVPVIFLTVAYYQRKFNETGRASGVSSPHVQLDS